ncbi:MAG: DUF2786 domain-containing protein [Deltaproteobacteria bacterium]|jgi:hypothetical protein|nr:DUF2786 domain-containing protein [Deltaproteobacteria bacterium]
MIPKPSFFDEAQSQTDDCPNATQQAEARDKEDAQDKTNYSFHDDQKRLESRYKSEWLKHLRSEHHRAVKCLLATKEMPFCASVLQITIDFFASKRRWGFWDPQLRLIGVNERLPLICGWSQVVGILLHETAHQLLSDLMPRAAAEPPHGPTFQRLCDQLKLDPIYRRSGIDLTDQGTPPSVFGPRREIQDHPILIKVKKLLAVASSPSPHEAATALAAAGRLMAKHNLELPEVDSETVYERRQISLDGTRISRRDHLTGMIIQAHFFTKVIFGYEYYPKINKSLRTMELVGRPVNLSMAEHVHFFLKERSESLWQAYRPKARLAGEKGLGAKSAFIDQLLRAFHEKLATAEMEPRSDGQRVKSSALILADDVGLNRFFEESYPHRTSAHRSGRTAWAPNSAKAGREAGQALTLHAPLGDSGGGGDSRLLEHAPGRS